MKLFGLAIALSSLILLGSANQASAQIWNEHQFMDGAPVDLTLVNECRPRMALDLPILANPCCSKPRAAICPRVITQCRVVQPCCQPALTDQFYRSGLYGRGRYDRVGGGLFDFY